MAYAYADQKARLLVHARTAGAALSPVMEDVQYGLPWPKGRCVRLWYSGEADPPRFESRGGLGTGFEMVGKVTGIAAYWPMTAMDEELARTIDAEAEAFSHALRTAVDGDSGLNGSADNTILGDATPVYPVFGGTRYFALTWDATTAYIEYAMTR